MAERRNFGRGTCQVCDADCALTSNGRIRTHGPKDDRCGGGSDLPKEALEGAESATQLPAMGEGPNPFREPVTDQQARDGESGTPRAAEFAVVLGRPLWPGQGDTFDPEVYGPDPAVRQDTPEEAEYRARLVANRNTPDMVREIMGDRHRPAAGTTTQETMARIAELEAQGVTFNPKLDPVHALEEAAQFNPLVRGTTFTRTPDAAPLLSATDMVGAARENNPQFRTPAADAFDAAPPQGSPVPADAKVAHAVRPGPEKDDFDQWGRYKLPDPATGEKTGRQRVTTFAKMISDQYGLGEWQQRMLLKGATMRPDLVSRAAGLDVKEHRGPLDAIKDELKHAAGDEVAANHGTNVHRFTELFDLGQTTVDNVPDIYRADVAAYVRAMEGANLRVLPDMVERTTMSRAVAVAGTLDRILQLPNGEFVIGDVKTGKDLSYGWLDIGIQLACYAHGVNENGVWDWATRTWLPAPKVRTDFAIVMHMPVGTGTCTFYRVDIARGWANATLAVQVREARKVRTHSVLLALDGPEFQGGGSPTPPLLEAVPGQPLPEVPAAAYGPGSVPLPEPAPGLGLQLQPSPLADAVDRSKVSLWWERMSKVTRPEEAGTVYNEAAGSGLTGPALGTLMEVGKAALDEAGAIRSAFYGVATQQQAGELYERAAARPETTPEFLAELVALASEALRR